jgi:hypothetical protein
MKTIALVIPLLGAVLVASAEEPSTNTITAPATSLWTRADAGSDPSSNAPPASDLQATQAGERRDLSTAVTLKPPRPAGGPVLSLFNPLAPVAPEPTTRWAARAPWVAVAEKSGRAPSAVEVRHEPRFGVMLCGW